MLTVLYMSAITFITILSYVFGFFYLLINLVKGLSNKFPKFQNALALILLFHLITVVDLLLVDNGLDLSLFKTFVLIAFIINTVIFISSFNKSLHSMYLVLFPISIFSLLLGQFISPTKTLTDLSLPIQIHIIISFLSYSFLAIAALHSMMTGYHHLQLKQKNQNFLINSFPPLQTMENFLFELIWIGVVLLTLSLGSGFLFYDNLFEQKLLHKVILSSLAWITYVILLWGRYQRGWRGNVAIAWTWAGFISILMAYVGSKIVIEFLLI